MSEFYIEQITAKNGTKVATFSNGKTFYSSYNPEKDAQNFCENPDFLNAGFLLVGGIGNGYHIAQLKNKFPQKFILVFEIDKKSLETLQKQNDFSKILCDNVKFTTLENLENDLIQYYNPALFENFYFTSVRSWKNFFSDFANEIKEKINNALSTIKADFSVQNYFGKIWMKNIFQNLRFVNGETHKKNVFKTCAIISAGPTLDNSIEFLKKNSQHLTIIATDTALPVLLEHKIKVDFVVSIDCQIFSHEHFVLKNWSILCDTIFLFDLCGQNSCVKKIKEKNGKIIFFKSNHPMCKKIEEFSTKNFIQLDCGFGTVTSAAFSLAKKLECENIIFIASDFSYPNGKPYCKGTYLEKKFNFNQRKINSIEKQNVSLMYRSEIQLNKEKIPTTQLLQNYCEKQKILIKEAKVKCFVLENSVNSMDLPIFDEKLLKNSCETIILENPQLEKNALIENLHSSLNETEFLPFLAWAKRQNLSHQNFAKLATKLIDNYNFDYEK